MASLQHGHGGSRRADGTRTRPTSTYTIWSNMKRRCLDLKSSHYHLYGGRGITVCERWMDFTLFLSDMGERPDGLSLERRDNNAGYSPDNCYWATNQEQCANRRLRSAKGHIYKDTSNPNPIWVFMICIGGKSITVTYKTEQEALDAQADYIFEREMHRALGATAAMFRH